MSRRVEYSGLGAALDTVTGSFVPAPPQPVKKPLPGWLIPAAIGAAVLLLMAVTPRKS